MPIVARDTWTNPEHELRIIGFLQGAMFYANDVGTKWVALDEQWRVLVPMVRSPFTRPPTPTPRPTGTINTGSSGNITFGTAASRAYTEGLYVYLPSIATTPAITAGWYWW